MKISPKLTVLSSVAALLASPVALGNEPELAICEMIPAVELPVAEVVTPTVSECWEILPGELITCIPLPCEVVEVVLPTGGPTNEDGVILGPEDLGTTVVPEVTDEKVTITDETEVPIEWVIRTDSDSSGVIFQNMAGAPTPTTTGGAVASAVEQDEQGNTIRVVDKSEAPQVSREKQQTVAVVKEGRVFLR